MPLNGNELARRSGGAIQMRAEPLRLRVRIGELPAADAHRVELTLACSVAALDRRGEREMFAETFLGGRDVATSEDVAAHFAAALKQPAGAVLATQPGRHWMDGSNQPTLLLALREAAARAAFACGVEVLPPFDLEVSSSSLLRETLEARNRQLSEQRTAGQISHMQRTVELLRQFESLRQTMPALSPGELLGRVSESDRGSMLQALMTSSSGGNFQRLWAVAGTQLVKIDPHQASPRHEVIDLPADVGPLRSVQARDADLLVGAQTGVMIVDPAHPAQAVTLRDPEISSQLGFNSVAASGGMIWASHRDSGVVAWRTSDPVKPAKMIRSARGAGNLVALDAARVLYSIAGDVFLAGVDSDLASISTAASPVALIAVESDRLLIVRADGTIEHLDRETLERTGMQKRCGEVTSAGILPWLGSSRLLLATADGPICCVGIEDGVVTQYLSAHRALRTVAACGDVVAGMSGDRQRLVLWAAWAGEKPMAEIHIGSIARHRAADLCFA